MATNSVKFSELATAPALDGSDIFAISAQDTTQTPAVWVSYKTTLNDIALKAVAGTTFNNLKTTSKFVEGAINEICGLVLTSTLTAGSTTLTFSNQAITANSTLEDIYASVFGLFPTNAVFASGSLTLTFDAQSSDVDIKVRIT